MLTHCRELLVVPIRAVIAELGVNPPRGTTIASWTHRLLDPLKLSLLEEDATGTATPPVVIEPGPPVFVAALPDATRSAITKLTPEDPALNTWLRRKELVADRATIDEAQTLLDIVKQASLRIAIHGDARILIRIRLGVLGLDASG